MLETQATQSLENIDIDKPNIKAWLICFVAALFFFYEFIQMNMLNAFSTELMQVYHLDASQLSELSSYYFYANILFLLPAGMILDRVSTRKVILTSMLVCVLGTFAFAMANDLMLAKLFRFLTGIGSAFCFLSCIRLATRWFPARRMALVSGLIVTMAMMGGMVAQTPLTRLSELVGWRNAILLDGGLGIAIMLLIYVFVKDYPNARIAEYERNKFNIQSIGFWQSMSKSYLNLQNWLCGIYTCLMNAPISVFGALWGGLYLEQIHHLSATDASYVTSMLFIGTVIGSPSAGWISDKLGSRRIPMIIGSIAALILVYILIYWPMHNVVSLMVVFFALSFVTSTQVVSYPLVAETNSRVLTASSISVVSFTTISGFPILQQLFGYLMDLHWNKLVVHNQAIYSATNFHLALLILPIGFIIALIASLLIRESHCRSID